MKQFTEYEKNENMQKLEKDLDYHTSLRNAWKEVTRNYKKDGKPFSNLAKNFNGLYVSNSRYSLHEGEKELSVHICSNRNGYISEDITNCETVQYSKFSPSADRIIKVSCVKDYFFLTVDEIESKIKDRIAYHENRIAKINKAIADSEHDNEILSNLMDYIEQELKKVNSDTASNFKSKVLRNYY